MHIVRVHVVGPHADGVVAFDAPLAIVLSHDVFTVQAPGFSNVHLVRPVIVILKFILRQSQTLEM